MDDSIVPRAAARVMLGTVDGLRLVGEASSGKEALRASDSLKPDLVLMDVHMPDMDGPATTRAFLAKHPGTKIIAWTVSESGDDLIRMMQAGCVGYVLKDAGPEELQRALMAALRSEQPVPRKMIPDVIRRVVEQAPMNGSKRVALTAREMDILRAVAKGHTTKRMAQDFRLAPTSIDTHLHNIFKKLDVNNRGEAVSAALRMGLITLADV